ncbi:MAG: glycerol-3-phosphate 1-O-acyltransferase PlsY [Lachnospiraceae bacterium]|nr:glycerol-3-phosphate 1-O-acyltransferase PlsY [Lachnospiraceae bacterium]
MGIEIVYRIACLVVGYGFGLFQTAYIIGKIHHIDIREYGSGNSGATNALRVLRKKAGAMVFIGDFMKCIIACLIARLIFNQIAPEITLLMVIYTAIGVVLGHIFPFYMGFKGGKGISAIGGAVVSLLDYRVTFPCLIVFILVVLISRYVSLGSIILMIQMWAMYTTFVLINPEPVYHLGQNYVVESIVVLGFLAALAIYKHKANIVRLVHGEESKLGQKKKAEDAENEG